MHHDDGLNAEDQITEKALCCDAIGLCVRGDYEVKMEISCPPELEMGRSIEQYKKKFIKSHESSISGLSFIVGPYQFMDGPRLVHMGYVDDTVVSIEILLYDKDSFLGIDLRLPVEEFVRELEKNHIGYVVNDDAVVLQEHFVALYYEDSNIQTIGWWDRDHWDQVSFDKLWGITS